MMTRFREWASQIGALSEKHAATQFRASLFVKLALVTGGATMAAVAHSVELAHANEAMSVWTIAGLAGAAIVMVGGIYVVLTETDASKAIETARKAIEDVRELEDQMIDFQNARALLNGEIARGLQLYNSMDVMRGCIEQSLDLPDASPPNIIQTCLSAASTSLQIALNFSIKDTWTICVFAAHKLDESDKTVLKCIAQVRKIECSIAEARVWPEGVGVAGVAYSTGNEIIIPDMAALELGTVFNLKTNTRDYDADRYRSMVAIPITVAMKKIPWGVAVVTADRPLHFSPEKSDGVSTVEPVRAIAAMAALAVKALEKKT
jgi:hypothetical protein